MSVFRDVKVLGSRKADTFNDIPKRPLYGKAPTRDTSLPPLPRQVGLALSMSTYDYSHWMLTKSFFCDLTPLTSVKSSFYQWQTIAQQKYPRLQLISSHYPQIVDPCSTFPHFNTFLSFHITQFMSFLLGQLLLYLCLIYLCNRFTSSISLLLF